MKISINNLTFKAIIGILPFERKQKQTVIVDLSFEYQYSNNNFIDYAKVAKLVKKNIKKQKYKLLEDALYNIEKLLLSKYSITNLKLQISKPTILKDCIVSVAL